MPKEIQFDNLEDVSSKFSQTICYYENKAVFVKQVSHQIDPNNSEQIPDKFRLVVCAFNMRNKNINLEDKAFTYKKYNIGYANTNNHCLWWYRKPIKQYRQGLIRSQLGFSSSENVMMPEENFNFSRPYVNMLENVYPEIPVVEKVLKDKEAKTIAFHKDFALSYDYIHQDFILEYRGTKVGVSLNGNLGEYKILNEYKHLNEALQEALA